MGYSHSQCLLSFSITIDRQIFAIFILICRRTIVLFAQHVPFFLTKSSNKTASNFFASCVCLCNKIRKTLNGGGSCTFNELFLERASNDRLQSERQDTTLKQLS